MEFVVLALPGIVFVGFYFIEREPHHGAGVIFLARAQATRVVRRRLAFVEQGFVGCERLLFALGKPLAVVAFALQGLDVFGRRRRPQARRLQGEGFRTHGR
ncbi:MAG: hypothetical protein JNJ60_09650 [Rhodocyclaceae bacterium]|nr:hypothetical protein [Rhodocyclaceae bacterium]